MSRHILHKDNYTIIVGFDNPLQTFFVQVFDKSEPDEDKQLIFWKGCLPDEIPSVNKLKEIVAPYFALDTITKDKLQKDLADKTEPSPLQKLAAKLFQDAISDI